MRWTLKWHHMTSTVSCWSGLLRSTNSCSSVTVLDVHHVMELFSHLESQNKTLFRTTDDIRLPPECCLSSHEPQPPPHEVQSPGNTGEAELRRVTCTPSSRTWGRACGDTGTRSWDKCPGRAGSSHRNKTASHSSQWAEPLLLALRGQMSPGLTIQLTGLVVMAWSCRVRGQGLDHNREHHECHPICHFHSNMNFGGKIHTKHWLLSLKICGHCNYTVLLISHI